MHIQLLSKTKQKPIVILINVQIIQQSIVNNFNEEKHILVDQKDSNIFLVIKNKERLVRLFDRLESLVNNYRENREGNEQCESLAIVSYSSKPINTVYERFAKVNKYVADNMYYFDVSQNKHSTVRPNRAFINKNNEKNLNLITYGEGYSQIKSKQELRLALQCAFSMHEQNQHFFIIQTEKGLKQQEKQLKKQGYKHLWTIDNFDIKESFEICFNNVVETQKQERSKLGNIMEEQTVDESYYLKTLKLRLKQDEFKEIVSNIQFSHVTDVEKNVLSPIKQINDFLSKPKKSYTPAPKSSIRSQDSKQICSLIFKNVSDHKLYIAKSSTPKDSGGLYYEEKIQNKCFMAMIGNLFAQACNKQSIFYSLPLDKSYCMMKYSLLKAYETKKTCALIKPYLEDIICLQKFGEEFVQLLRMQQSPIRGFGQMIFWSLVSGESFNTKTLLQQVSVLGQQEKLKGAQNEVNKKVHYISRGFKSIKSFMNMRNLDSVNLLRVDYFEPLSALSEYNNFFSQKQNTLTINLTRNYLIPLNQLNTTSLKQIYQLATLITGQDNNTQRNTSKDIGFQLIKGLAAYYKWQYDKTELIDSFFTKTKKLKSYVQQIFNSRNESLSIDKTLNLYSCNEVISNFLTQLQQLNPLTLLLFMSQDYGRFIKPLSQDETYFGEFFSKISQEKQNRYVTTLIQKTHSFQIYGNCSPIYSLPNWVRSLGVKYRFIEYISMLNSTKEDFILISKRLKIMATNEKNNALLIVDHAQLCEDILDEAKNVRTIFFSRFKKGQHEMQVIYEQQNESKENKYLQDSNDELITMLMEVYERYCVANNEQRSYLFKRYQFVFENYIKIKCQQYGFSSIKAREFCLQLHKNILQSKNRFKEIQQRYKQNDEWKLLYALPVEKKNQKITFIKNLHSFIDVLKFVQLLNGEEKDTKSMCVENKQIKGVLKINPKLLPSLREWERFIEPEIKNEKINQLICYVTPLASIQIKQYLQTQKEIDDFGVILQTLEIILSPYKNLKNRVGNSTEEKRLFIKWNELYYSLFPEQQGLYHFLSQSIINLTTISSNLNQFTDQLQQKISYLIQTNEKLTFYNFNPVQQKCEKQCEIDGKLQIMSIMWKDKNSESEKMKEQQSETSSNYKLVLKQEGSSDQQLKILSCNMQKKEALTTLSDNNNKLQQKQQIAQLQIIVTLKSQQLTISCLAKNQQQLTSIKYPISNSDFNEDVLDFQIISFSDTNHCSNPRFLLIVLLTHNILFYKIKFYVNNQNNGIQIESAQLESTQKNNYKHEFNLYKDFISKQGQNSSSIIYEFLSLVNYNRLSNRDKKQKINNKITILLDKVNEKRQLKKCFIYTVSQQIISEKVSSVVKIHLDKGLRRLFQTNKNSPIIYIPKSTKSSIQSQQNFNIIVLLVNQSNKNKSEEESILCQAKHNPCLAIINLSHPTCQFPLIPLFDISNTSSNESFNNNLFKIMHFIDIQLFKSNQHQYYIQAIVYYSLAEVKKQENNFQTGYPKVVNTSKLLIPFNCNLCDYQNNSFQQSLIYCEPKTHIFQYFGSSKNCVLSIMPLQQTSQKESYIFTIQGSLDSFKTQANDDCIRLWKLNNV